MKKIIILLFISNIVFAQNIAKKEVLEANLFKNWVADYAMLNGLRVEKMGQMKSLQYSFKSDGTYIAQKNIQGNWKYNAKKKCIDLFLNGVLKSTIITLQNKKFVMVLAPDKAAPKGTTFEIYFKPKK